jgi:hypothetical protein
MSANIEMNDVEWRTTMNLSSTRVRQRNARDVAGLAGLRLHTPMPPEVDPDAPPPPATDPGRMPDDPADNPPRGPDGDPPIEPPPVRAFSLGPDHWLSG